MWGGDILYNSYLLDDQRAWEICLPHTDGETSVGTKVGVPKTTLDSSDSASFVLSWTE